MGPDTMNHNASEGQDYVGDSAISRQPQDGHFKDTDGSRFTCRLDQLVSRLDLEVTNIQVCLTSITKEEETAVLSGHNEKLQAQTKFFGGLNEMLNSMEYEIDRLESIKDRLEL